MRCLLAGCVPQWHRMRLLSLCKWANLHTHHRQNYRHILSDPSAGLPDSLDTRAGNIQLLWCVDWTLNWTGSWHLIKQVPVCRHHSCSYTHLEVSSTFALKWGSVTCEPSLFMCYFESGVCSSFHVNGSKDTPFFACFLHTFHSRKSSRHTPKQLKERNQDTN